MKEPKSAGEPSRKPWRVPSYMTLSVAAQRLNISVATLHNWWDWGEIPPDEQVAPNGRMAKAVSRKTYKQLRERYPVERTDKNASLYDSVRTKKGRLKTGGKVGVYAPRSLKGHDRVMDRLAGYEESISRLNHILSQGMQLDEDKDGNFHERRLTRLERQEMRREIKQYERLIEGTNINREKMPYYRHHREDYS